MAIQKVPFGSCLVVAEGTAAEWGSKGPRAGGRALVEEQLQPGKEGKRIEIMIQRYSFTCDS